MAAGTWAQTGSDTEADDSGSDLELSPGHEHVAKALGQENLAKMAATGPYDALDGGIIRRG